MKFTKEELYWIERTADIECAIEFGIKRMESLINEN